MVSDTAAPNTTCNIPDFTHSNNVYVRALLLANNDHELRSLSLYNYNHISESNVGHHSVNQEEEERKAKVAMDGHDHG